jgi:Rrf2 family transcriptional regulator, cysteine metabolism repressor
MRISSKGHYGLLAVAELARRYDRGLISLSEIAAVEHLPLPYLEQIIAPLRMAGLVEAMRGLHGGYRLARNPADVSVGEVVRWLEGPIALVECTTEGYQAGACEREAGCTSRGVWRQVSDAINDVLNTLTLADLIAEESAKQAFVSIGIAGSHPHPDPLPQAGEGIAIGVPANA